MKKILIPIFLIMSLLFIVYAFTLSNPTPTDGSTITGLYNEFGIHADEQPSSAFVNINNGSSWQGYPLSCNYTGVDYYCNTTVNLTSFIDMSWYQYYFTGVDGGSDTTPIYQFFINRPPSKVQNLNITGIDEHTLNLTWDNINISDFLIYNIYRDNTTNVSVNTSHFIGNTTSTSYLDTNLTTGVTYCYLITAVDNISQEGQPSDRVCQLVQDFTPPVDPNVTPPSGSVVNTSPHIIIDYSSGGENVTLKIYSGSTLVKQYLTPSILFNWYPSLINDTMYSFTFKAYDIYNNVKETPYTITTYNDTSINFNISEIYHMTISTRDVVISNALPGEYFLIHYNLDIFGGNSIRVRMDDLTDGINTIDIPTDSQPFIFCESDYNATTQDFDGSGDVYYVLNNYNESASALNCSYNPFSFYLKIPIPSNAESGSYSSNIHIGLYN